DYFCPSCESSFQLKSQSRIFGSKIVDAAYSEMKRAIAEDRTPNLFTLHYDLDSWTVRNVLLIPRFAFALSAVERRRPLAAHGAPRRLGGLQHRARQNFRQRPNPHYSGWKSSPQAVRDDYERLRPLEKLKVEKRGWTLDVLNVVCSLGKKEFSLQDVYAH